MPNFHCHKMIKENNRVAEEVCALHHGHFKVGNFLIKMPEHLTAFLNITLRLKRVLHHVHWSQQWHEWAVNAEGRSRRGTFALSSF